VLDLERGFVCWQCLLARVVPGLQGARVEATEMLQQAEPCADGLTA